MHLVYPLTFFSEMGCLFESIKVRHKTLQSRFKLEEFVFLALINIISLKATDFKLIGPSFFTVQTMFGGVYSISHRNVN